TRAGIRLNLVGDQAVPRVVDEVALIGARAVRDEVDLSERVVDVVHVHIGDRIVHIGQSSRGVVTVGGGSGRVDPGTDQAIGGVGQTRVARRSPDREQPSRV